MAVWGWDDIKGDESAGDAAANGGKDRQLTAVENMRRFHRLIGAMICALFIAVLSYYSRSAPPQSPGEDQQAAQFSAR